MYLLHLRDWLPVLELPLPLLRGASWSEKANHPAPWPPCRGRAARREPPQPGRERGPAVPPRVPRSAGPGSAARPPAAPRAAALHRPQRRRRPPSHSLPCSLGSTAPARCWRRLSPWASLRCCCRRCFCRWRWPRAARRCAACGGAGGSAAGTARWRSERRCRAACTARCSAGASSRYGTESRALERPFPPGQPASRGKPSPPTHSPVPAAARPLRLGWHRRGSSQASFGGCSVLSPA